MLSLPDAYRGESPALMTFYAGPARSVFEPSPRFGALPEITPWDPLLVEEMRAYQRGLGLERSFAGNEAVIVTGQQPGLFSGPLYTIYKAMTAIKLAARLERTHARPVVPVFWLGSDDHDFEEARSVSVLTRRHQPLRLTYAPAQPVDALPLHRIPAEDSLHGLVDALAEAVPGSEHAPAITEWLHQSLDGAESFAAWTARLLARLFRDTPLVIFEPRLPAARRIAAPVLAREIASPLAGTTRLREAARQLEALGFAPQLVKAGHECNFFVEIDGRRRKVVFEKGVFLAPENQLSWTPAQMTALLESSPDRFSANVALRCVVQQALFPALAYVAGPGEIAYWAQLKEFFALFELPMPVVYPRASAVLTTVKLRKLLEKFRWAPSDVTDSGETLLDSALAAVAAHPALDALRRGRATVLGAVEALADAFGSLDAPSPARDAARALHARTAADLDRMERLLRRADQAQTAAVSKQVERLRHALAPDRKPQERVYTLFSFLFEHGWGLVPRLLNALDIESSVMTEIEL